MYIHFVFWRLCVEQKVSWITDEITLLQYKLDQPQGMSKNGCEWNWKLQQKLLRKQMKQKSHSQPFLLNRWSKRWWCYPTPSEGWGREGTLLRSNSRAMPQGLDQRSKMEEVVPKMARRRGSNSAPTSCRLNVVVRSPPIYSRGGPKWRDNYPDGPDHPVAPNRLETVTLRWLDCLLDCRLRIKLPFSGLWACSNDGNSVVGFKIIINWNNGYFSNIVLEKVLVFDVLVHQYILVI